MPRGASLCTPSWQCPCEPVHGTERAPEHPSRSSHATRFTPKSCTSTDLCTPSTPNPAPPHAAPPNPASPHPAPPNSASLHFPGAPASPDSVLQAQILSPCILHLQILHLPRSLPLNPRLPHPVVPGPHGTPHPPWDVWSVGGTHTSPHPCHQLCPCPSHAVTPHLHPLDPATSTAPREMQSAFPSPATAPGGRKQQRGGGGRCQSAG